MNKRPDLSTLYRWISKGYRGVVLESARVGGIRCTSREAVSRFLARLNRLERSDELPRSPAARQRADLQAKQELARMGL